ncbi:hypothetical protein [Nostoc sp.]|uniref:hypothetical protein n=1 Tax=Nostoc sp. TaxID=1180 RepID=UPI002FF8E1D9
MFSDAHIQASNLNLKLAEIGKSDAYDGKLRSTIIKFCQKLLLITSIVGHLLQTYLIVKEVAPMKQVSKALNERITRDWGLGIGDWGLGTGRRIITQHSALSTFKSVLIKQVSQP